jgi:hypothetical protein
MSRHLSEKQQNYQKIFVKTLDAELNFLIGIIHGREQARKTIQSKIEHGMLQMAVSGIGMIPVAGSIVSSIVSTVGEALLEYCSEMGRNVFYNSIMKLPQNKLRILIEQIAREASCRWDMAIHNYIYTNHDVDLFAMVGAIRIVEYLLRKDLPFNTGNALFGLIAGRSGAGELSWTNTKVSNGATGKKAKITIEGMYGRAGYMIGNKFYITSDDSSKKSESSIKAGLLKKRTAHETHYGYVKFIEEDRGKAELHEKRPKYGYVQLPSMEELKKIELNGFGFIEHVPDKSFYSVIKTGLPFKPKFDFLQARYVTVEEIRDYLSLVASTDVAKNFNEHIEAIALFRGVLQGTAKSPLDLSKGDFRGCDFSGATFIHCILGDCHEAYFTGASFQFVRATGNVLNNAHLDLTKIQDCNFTSLAGLQSSWAYSEIERSIFKNLLGISMELENAVLDDITQDSFSLAQTLPSLAAVDTKRYKAKLKEQKEAVQEAFA